MQIGYDRPDAYYAVDEEERAQRCTMTSDLADVDGKAFFIRCMLDVPVRGEQEPFGWGVWARVAEADFHRYRGLFRSADQCGEPPFPATLANQLPGYPQTVGVAASVQLTSDATRPTLIVVDGAHPLAAEQKYGVGPERVLELVSPWLHPGASRLSREPYFATLEADGWTLFDAEECLATWDSLNWLPSRERRRSLASGEAAKLLFRITASSEHGDSEEHTERMWVEVTERREAEAGPVYRGILTNRPYVPGLTRIEMEVWWTPRHMVDVCDEDGDKASEDGDVLRCDRHGPSFKTYVCQHLPRGRDLGFHQADDPEAPRPDAWCDACNEVLEAEGEWNERSEEFANITLLCTACYDIVAGRNKHA